jgi:diacylglycerol O-acyltransferase
MPIERLTAEDELMLWPDEVWPQDIGALVLMESGHLVGPDGAFRIEAAQQAVEGRLHLVPRFRQLLYEPPRHLGGPLWIDAPAFDIRDHVFAQHVPAPGDEPTLLASVERIRRRRLDRSRPLWEMWFLTGLHAGRVALFVRMHHCIADGMAGVATMAAFLDTSRHAAVSAQERWVAKPRPTEEQLREDLLSRRRAARRSRFSAVAHPFRSARQLIRAWPAIQELLAERSLPATSLARVVGPDRRLALVRSDLAAIRDMAHASSAKVNDVLLTVIAGGVRALLESRGELHEGQVVRIYVPISLHAGDRAEARGNLIAQMVVELPVGEPDPAVCLRRIAVETTARKARSRPTLGKVPHRGRAGRLFLRLIDRQHVNVSSADIPGPSVPLYFAGGRLLEVFPMVQLVGKNSLSVGAMSYGGGFNMMVVADRDGYPDLDVFTSGMRAQLEALLRPRGALVA